MVYLAAGKPWRLRRGGCRSEVAVLLFCLSFSLDIVCGSLDICSLVRLDRLPYSGGSHRDLLPICASSYARGIGISCV